MGSFNHYGDSKFMDQHQTLHRSFKQQPPLFDAELIAFPLSTSGMKIVDNRGRRVKIAGGNWSGGHMKRHCVGGLDERPLKDLCYEIKHKFDLNCIRLTFSLEMFYQNNIIEEKHISANKELLGLRAMEIFDVTVKAITDAGLMVFLNNHTSKSQWCCSDDDGDGLWYNKQYSEDDFFNCLVEMTKRYRNNPRVIGMDLRNQIRKGNGKTPTWGDGNIQTDWHRAAEIAGNAVQRVAPHWLIIVGGLQYQLDLTGVKEHPIKLHIPNKLVYTGHFYGFSWPLGFWKVRSQHSFREKIFNEQLYVRGLGVPFLLGQFGANEQDVPWVYLMRLLKDLDLDWCYWCLDGYKCDVKEEQTYGIWDYHFVNPRHPQMLKDIKRVGRPVQGLRLSSS